MRPDDRAARAAFTARVHAVGRRNASGLIHVIIASGDAAMLSALARGRRIRGLTAMAPGRSTCMVIVDKALSLTPAVVRATALARKSGDKLMLALFEFDRTLARAASRGFDLDAYKRGRAGKLEALAERLRQDGLTVGTRLYWGHPQMARMLMAVLAEQPRMVIKDVRRESALKRVLFAPEDLDLLRQCPAPLMLVRGGSHGLPGHVLAAVDPLDAQDRPQELDAVVLEAANRLAMQCDAELDVVHAFEYIPPFAVPGLLTGALPDMGLAERFRAMHLDALQAFGKRHGVPREHLHMLDGMPGPAIGEFAATNGIDLVVMGSVQRNFLQRLSIGSVAEDLLQRLDCDVLVLKPAGFPDNLRSELERDRAPAWLPSRFEEAT